VKSGYHVPDGNEALRDDIPAIVELIERTALWVHPDTFRALPVWAPHTARGMPLYNAAWTNPATNTRRSTGIKSDKFEGNVAAIKALTGALGVSNPKPKHWTVCHIWGYDDPSFSARSGVVQDPKYFSCVANMIWLPTALKGFTDVLPEIKAMLRTCSFYLYGWACEHHSVAADADEIRSGYIPAHYPEAWPSPKRPSIRPANTAPYSEKVMREIAKRKRTIANCLEDAELTHYPREMVRQVLEFWKIDLGAGVQQ